MSFATFPGSTATADAIRATQEVITREQRAAKAVLALSRLRESQGNIPAQPPFSIADAGRLGIPAGPAQGPILVRTYDAFPERVIAPLAPSWHDPSFHAAMARTVRLVTDFQSSSNQAAARPETAAQKYWASAATRFPREAWEGGAPAALYGLGALAGKKGRAAAAANQAAARGWLASLRAVGRDFKVGDMTSEAVMQQTYWPGSGEEYEALRKEAARVWSHYISWLVVEAKVYGIAPGEDVKTFALDKLAEFYDAVITYRKALVADAAQYQLGPNQTLPEPDRWLRLAEATNAARVTAREAGRGPGEPPPPGNGYRPPSAGPVAAPARYEPPPPEAPASKFIWIGLGLGLGALAIFTIRRRA